MASSEVIYIADSEYEVHVAPTISYKTNVYARTCTCRECELRGIPCVYGIACLSYARILEQFITRRHTKRHTLMLSMSCPEGMIGARVRGLFIWLIHLSSKHVLEDQRRKWLGQHYLRILKQVQQS